MGVTTRKKTRVSTIFETTWPMRWDRPNQRPARGLKALGQAMVMSSRTMLTRQKLGELPEVSQQQADQHHGHARVFGLLRG